MKSHFLVLNKPLSVIFSSGITGNDKNPIVIKASSNVHPKDLTALFKSSEC